jgi:transposase, IS30 family
MTPIEDRDVEVILRLEPGHWEGDLLKGANGKSCIATLVERLTRRVMLIKLDSARSHEVCQAIIKRTAGLPQHMLRSLTYDRGTEMAEHQSISNALGIPVFFCNAYSPWERGANENTNGLIRQYLSKGLDLSTVSEQTLLSLEQLLNDRPRRILDYCTPNEMFSLHLRA